MIVFLICNQMGEIFVGWHGLRQQNGRFALAALCFDVLIPLQGLPCWDNEMDIELSMNWR